MKIPRSIFVGAVVSTAALSSILSGCATTAQSQPLEANKTAINTEVPWRAKFGQQCSLLYSTQRQMCPALNRVLWQQCSLLYSTSVGNSLVVDDVLKSATDKWIVIGDVESADAVNGKIVYSTEEQYIPVANILCLSFSKPRKAG